MGKFEQQDPGYYEQLALGLNLEETDRVEAGFVSPEEARRRSLLAFREMNSAASEEGAVWVDRYRDLLNAGWPWRVACYIAWASSPRIGRWPATQQALAADVLGLTSDRVIATWRKKNPTIDQLIAEWQALPLLEHRADVFAALAKSASDPDHRHNPDRKVYLEMTGDYVPRAKLDVSTREVEDLSQMSDAELDKLARQIRGEDGGHPLEGAGRSAVSGQPEGQSGQPEGEE
jgi:hypothetical protein